MSQSENPICWVPEYINRHHYYIHAVRRVILHKQTPFQDLMIVDTDDWGRALILDGKWQSSIADEFLYHEPLVHLPSVFHGSPRRVLVLGGGEGATIREVLRWTCVERVVMVDIDRDVLDACVLNLPDMHAGAFDDPRVELIIGDALEYVHSSPAEWDLVISDLSDPVDGGPSVNLYTVDFFEKVRSILNSGGLFVTQAGPVGPSQANLQYHTRVVNTLRRAFPYALSYSSSVPTYPCPWGFALGSSAPLTRQPDPRAIDALLSTRTTGGFRMIDGEAILGLLQLPVYLRAAIDQEQRIYSLDELPRYE